MPDAGRGAVLARGSEAMSVESMARAYEGAAAGDSAAALRLAIADALASMAEMDQRTRLAARFVSRGFVRGTLNGVGPLR